MLQTRVPLFTRPEGAKAYHARAAIDSVDSASSQLFAAGAKPVTLPLAIFAGRVFLGRVTRTQRLHPDCADYDLCESCGGRNLHHKNHSMLQTCVLLFTRPEDAKTPRRIKPRSAEGDAPLQRLLGVRVSEKTGATLSETGSPSERALRLAWALPLLYIVPGLMALYTNALDETVEREIMHSQVFSYLPLVGGLQASIVCAGITSGYKTYVPFLKYFPRRELSSGSPPDSYIHTRAQLVGTDNAYPSGFIGLHRPEGPLLRHRQTRDQSVV
ncbi:hypothetical protein B0H13DRAFT_1853147 [Mycena leptocephala]|nr:hypothetical protein B0H13DRAFT_1853147 [Mycena leptocephala]